MSTLWLLQIAWGVNCPTSDLYADGLNAYAIVIDGQSWNFQLGTDIQDWSDIQERPVVQQWEQLFQACQADTTQNIFEQWLRDWLHLIKLGQHFHNESKWHFYQRYLLRREIRQYERTVALGYVEFLRALQLETGIAVRWDLDASFWSKGMISTAGGSDLIADYVYRVWK